MKKSGKNSFNILYHSKVVYEDIPRLSKDVRSQIKKATSNKLTTNPEIFGKPLRESLKGLRSMHVGSYRIVYLIHKGSVRIVIIQHRSVVYKEVLKRL